MNIKNISKLIVAIVVSELVGIIGAIFTTPAIGGWYSALIKPSFNPPNWIFGPVWTLLFLLMGIAAFLVWQKDLKPLQTKLTLGIFVEQLILNFLWSVIFFGQQNIGGALIEIILLWLMILATMVAFAKVSRSAAWLLLPYILWVTFAGVLNYSLWILNSVNYHG